MTDMHPTPRKGGAKSIGREEVRLSSLNKICDVFDCKIDDIIDYPMEDDM